MNLQGYNERRSAAQTAERLINEGYDVQYEVKSSSGAYFDLVARRNGRNIAFEFVKQDRLIQEVDEVSRMRRLALQEGYDDFRLVVVAEPRPSQIDFRGMNEALFS